MQISIFESMENKQSDIKVIVESIIEKDFMRRNYIKQAIKNNNKAELIDLFKKSMQSFNFGGDDYSWTFGKFTDHKSNMIYEISAEELADMALRIG